MRIARSILVVVSIGCSGPAVSARLICTPQKITIGMFSNMNGAETKSCSAYTLSLCEVLHIETDEMESKGRKYSKFVFFGEGVGGETITIDRVTGEFSLFSRAGDSFVKTEGVCVPDAEKLKF